MVRKILSSLLRISAPLILVATLLLATGCTTSATATKADEKNAFADYPVADILAAGNKALESGETERAVYIYMQALQIEQSAETWYRIGVGKARLGDKGYAWQAFKKAIELDPDHVGAQEELGLTYMAMAQPEQAKEHLKKATELDPLRWRAWNALGVLADMDKHYAEAVEYYHSGLIAAPQSPMLMTNIGYSYYLAGNMQEAGAWFGRALIAEANYPPAVKNLALLYARQGWYDEAVKTFSKVVSKPQAYNDVGYLALRQGDYNQAHELLSEAIRLSPVYYEKAYENLELVKKAMDAQGKASPADAALKSSGDQIVVAEGQAPRKAVVTAEILNVRSSAESDSDIVTHLKAGDPVEVIMTIPNWAYVNYRPAANDGNLTGWVNSRYVGSQEGQSTLVAVAETSVQESTVATAALEVTTEPANTETVIAAQELNVSLAVLPDAAVSAGTETVVVEKTEITAVTSESTDVGSLPASQPDVATANNALADAVTRKLEAVCEPGTQAEKTPQGAGSCIGVASLSADD